jgi:hypothetical protein
VRHVVVVVLGLASLALSCSGSDEAVGDPGRRGDACHDYQDALCDWVLACTPHVARAECEASASAIACVQDGRAERCTAAIDAATCREPPDDCELFDVADRAPARAACEQYGDAVCSARASCGTQSAADCRAELETLDCSAIVGVKPSFPDCIDDLRTADCGQIPPPSCDDVLLGEPMVPMSSPALGAAAAHF